MAQNGKGTGKVLLVGLVSIFVIAVLSFFLISQNLKKEENLEKLKTSILISTRVSAVVHELQKERGRTAGFLGSGGETFKEELKAQRAETDKEIAKLEELLNKETLMAFPPKIRQELVDVLDNLKAISSERLKVDSKEVTLRQAIAFYTNLDNKLIDLVARLAHYAKEADISRELLGYSDLMYAKEKAGLERAILSVAFANNKFSTPQLFQRFVDLMAQQKAFLKSFELAAPENVVRYYREVVSSSQSAQQVKNYEELALQTPFQGGWNVDPNLWFSTITQKINLMKKVEDYTAQDLISRITEKLSAAKSELYITFGLAAIAILIIVVVMGTSIKTAKEEG
ncbi:nitrate- and nitrite sensing domain-containing protein [Thermovibrio ammonificans]|uniref:Methyl-accepting chemotaxis protein n=1 Tax=Thermovibrio ammonificans (strain DSM 15698 / JCM 12110 / HB-1) TaxID=648996 RepID=E8T299_THEA1|nr:nitrate- and nitrite sensing domain-containing protein [Thermovibrio ammonificans]ADU96994.1 methyl-accepting chemotaxis protein [Thermovibrio ammonificans HB-1]